MEATNSGFDVLVGFSYLLITDVSEVIIDKNYGVAEVVPANGKSWIAIPIAEGKGQWNEISGKKGGSVMWEQTGNVNCPRDILSDWNELNSLGNKKVLVRLEFNNGAKLIGTKESGVNLIVETASKSGIETNISFKKVSRYRALWVA